MKQNKYDDDVFFEKYGSMERSKKGLDGAGEWATLKKLLPDFKGKRVLDLGCGYGWHCVYAAQNGASSVLGMDISGKMIAVAKKKCAFDNVSYMCMPVEDARFDASSFDIVISSLALHYIESFDDTANKISEWLTEKGVFVFSVEHPVFTSYGTQDWIYDENGEIKYFPVDNYFREGKRDTDFLGEKVTKYHRTLTTYIDGLIKNGFEIVNITEPQPEQPLIDTIPGMINELRRPMMLIISARKR